MRSGVRIGDVIEIPTSAGLAYVLYTHEHPRAGSVIRVLPGLYPTRQKDLVTLVQQHQAYAVIFPQLDNEIVVGSLRIVGHQPVPDSASAFPLFRAPGRAELGTGEVRNWWLWDGEREWRIGELNPEHYDLPIREVPSTSLFVQRLTQGWRPRDRIGKPRSRTANPEIIGADARGKVPLAHSPRPLHYYLTFPSKAAAEAAAGELADLGLDVAVHRGRSDEEWYVYANQRPLPADLPAMRSRLTRLAQKFGGTYDGWDLRVGP